MDEERFTCGRRGRRWRRKREGCGGVNVFAIARQGPARSTSVGSVDPVNYLILSSGTQITSKQLRTYALRTPFERTDTCIDTYGA